MTKQLMKNTPSGHLTNALLPWESETEFIELRDKWRSTYMPQGPAEDSLVDQLVWIDWRRRRLISGERALHINQLHSRTGTGESYSSTDPLTRRALVYHSERKRTFNSRSAISTTEGDDKELDIFVRENLSRLKEAQLILKDANKNAYTNALGYLDEGSLEWWEEEIQETENGFEASSEGLTKFIEEKLLPWFKNVKHETEERPIVRMQAYGESLDPHRMNTLMALDERLGRQFEKAMSMLIRLQELRGKMP
ncbi:hypothetical protein [Hirschia litorea]|uniref:Uncharacterized protein n=1 Tax=Hirschia litorea TaxID=1199156 RepID=A0ABW2IH32_9PROT